MKTLKINSTNGYLNLPDLPHNCIFNINIPFLYLKRQPFLSGIFRNSNYIAHSKLDRENFF